MFIKAISYLPATIYKNRQKFILLKKCPYPDVRFLISDTHHAAPDHYAYHIESRYTDLRRMDVVVDFGRDQFIVELKIWHGDKYKQ